MAIQLTPDQWLFMATREGNLHEMQVAIDASADVNAASEYTKDTPLHIATGDKHIAAIKLLLNAGADVNRKDNYGYTPLQKALEFEHQESAMTLLLKGRALVDLTSPNTTPSLCKAAYRGFIDVMQVLLDPPYEVNVDAPDGQGWSAMHYAAKRGHIAALRLLLDHGANVNARLTEDPITPLDLTAHRNKKEAAALLITKGGIPSGFLTEQAEWLQDIVNETLANLRWTPETHHDFSPQVKRTVETLLVAWNLDSQGHPHHPEYDLHTLPLELVFEIADKVAVAETMQIKGNLLWQFN